MVSSKVYEAVPEQIEVIEWPRHIEDQREHIAAIQDAVAWITQRGGEVKMVGDGYYLKSTSMGWVRLPSGSFIAYWVRSHAFEHMFQNVLAREWREESVSVGAVRDIIMGEAKEPTPADNPPSSADFEALKQEYAKLVEGLPASKEQFEANIEAMRREREAIDLKRARLEQVRLALAREREMLEGLKNELTSSHVYPIPEVGFRPPQFISCVMCYSEHDEGTVPGPAVYITNGHAVCAEHVDEVIEQP